MKIRIKGNSIRIRLSKSEVDKMSREGYIEERTSFVNNEFIYGLQSADAEMHASFENNKITIFIPRHLVSPWQDDVVGHSAHMPLTGKNSLFILVEKDFVCLDETTEDQSDNYENPNKTC